MVLSLVEATQVSNQRSLKNLKTTADWPTQYDKGALLQGECSARQTVVVAVLKPYAAVLLQLSKTTPQMNKDHNGPLAMA
eukprot:3958651-Amphidinium_carterae.1